MKRGVSIVGILIALAGIVWFLQGIGLLKGGFMTNNPTWVIIGAVAAIVGIGLIVWVNRQQPGSTPPAP
jgi:divalent metal cation (Fe/Co/Zn/Cd) transporter